MVTSMFLSFPLFAFFTNLPTAATNCSRTGYFQCSGYKLTSTNTMVFTKDRSLCNGSCYIQSSCVGVWSAWEPTDFTYNGHQIERRHKNCQTIEEMELKRLQLNKTNSGKDTRMRRDKTDSVPKAKLLSRALNMVEADLKSLDAKFTVAMGKSVQISCDTLGSEAIIKIFPKAQIEWILNNVKLKLDPNRMKSNGLHLQISNVIPSDQGLYTCRLEYQPKSRKTVYFATLVLKENGIPVDVLETKTLKLHCPSSPIGRLFPKSVREWVLKGVVVASAIEAIRRANEVFFNASKKHEGTWTCRVVDQESNRNWQLIKYQVVVNPLPPPENETKLFIKSHPILVISQSLGVLGFLLAVFIGVCHKPSTPKKEIGQKTESTDDSSENSEKRKLLSAELQSSSSGTSSFDV